MRFRVAGISFLNTWPLIDALPELAPDRIELSLDLPSRLPDLLRTGAADAALIPAVEYLRGAGAAVVPGVAIGSPGPVDSVKLFHDVPPERIREVAIDRGSRTSVALMRVLLARLHGVEPELETFSPGAGDPLAGRRAALVIGDRCFAAEKALREAGRGDVRALDLAAAWRGMTGLPFVFAVWAVSRDFLASASAAEAAELAGLLREGASRGLDRVDRLAERAAAAGMLGVGGYPTAAAIRDYFTVSLDYSLGDDQIAALTRFRDLAAEIGACPPDRGIELLRSP